MSELTGSSSSGPRGTYALLVGTADGSDGAFSVKARWRVPRPARRTLDAASVVTLPVLLSVNPARAPGHASIPVTLAVDFGWPGARAPPQGSLY